MAPGRGKGGERAGGRTNRRKYGDTVLRAVPLITVRKVFLGDMGGLTSLYRAASFLGLGLSLVGIGYLYQRFVFADTAQAAIRQCVWHDHGRQ